MVWRSLHQKEILLSESGRNRRECISSRTSPFRSWAVIFHLRQPMAFLSLNLNDTPGACSSYECFILRAGRLSSKLLKQGYLVERLKSSFRKFHGRYGDLIQQYEVSLSRMLNDILTLDEQWLPNQSDFPPISSPWYRLWPSPKYEWFPWSICNGCGMPAGNAYPSGHLVPPPPHFGTCLIISRTCDVFTRLFHLEYPLVLSRFCLESLKL